MNRSTSYQGTLEPLNSRTLEFFSTISSLYIHIPFCVRKCSYCDFYSVRYDESLACAYSKAVCKELRLKRELSGILKTIYFGGGTPSLLPDECFSRIFSCLRDSYSIADDAEITIEANPGTLNQAKTDHLLSLGVNRISLGVQSFDDNELSFLGRIHTADDALSSLEQIRKSGLSNYSIDLMYGIEGQSMDSWRNTIAVATACKPKHISTYELTPESGTPIFKRVSKPEEGIILDMYDYAIDGLAPHGYEHYEISNFAEAGYRCAHNLNYWNRGGYVGAGAGAHSFMNGMRSYTIPNIDRYLRRLDCGLLPEAESTQISGEEGLKEFLLLGLRKTEGIKITDAHALGLDLLHAGRVMIEEGYLEIRNNFLRCTRKGIVISNALIVKLFQYLGL